MHHCINLSLQFIAVAQQAKLPGKLFINLTLAEEILVTKTTYQGGIIPSSTNYTALFLAMDKFPTDGYVTPQE